VREWFIIVSIVLIAVLGAIWMPLDRKMARQLREMRLAPPPGTPGAKTYTWQEKTRAYRRRVIMNSSFLAAIMIIIVAGIGWPSLYFNRQVTLTYTMPEVRTAPQGAAWQLGFTGEVGLAFVPGTDTAIVVNTQVHFIHIFFVTATGQVWQQELPVDSYPEITASSGTEGTVIGVRSGSAAFSVLVDRQGQVVSTVQGLPSGARPVSINLNGTAEGERLRLVTMYKAGFWVGSLGNTVVTAVPK